jgi:GT2 family glycosyltransferase
MDSIQSAKVGVVTVTYNSGEVIDDFMTSMLAQDRQDYILYIIDNASSDDTLAKVSKYQDDRIVVIANKDNVGVAEGNNQGIKDSIDRKCSHVLLINNDTVFEPSLISELIKGLDEHECEMIVPKIMYHHEPNTIWCAGGYFDSFPTYTGKAYGDGEIDAGQYDLAKQISYGPTCCMLIKIESFEDVGLMDEKYFVYYDDTDFCFRSMKSNKVLFYEPKIKLYHKANSLTGAESQFTVYHLSRNRIYYIRKNLSFLSQLIGIAFCQLRYLLGLISGKESLAIFFLKQKAFVDGMKMSVN